jgi:hypothetical protein
MGTEVNLIFIKLMPASFSETDLISSQVINLPPVGNDLKFSSFI